MPTTTPNEPRSAVYRLIKKELRAQRGDDFDLLDWIARRADEGESHRGITVEIYEAVGVQVSHGAIGLWLARARNRKDNQ